MDCEERNVPDELSLCVATLYKETGVQPFDLKQTILFNEVNDDPSKYSPKQVVEAMNQEYVSLDCHNQWPQTNQKKEYEIVVMKAMINNLQQTFDSIKSGSR